MHGEFGIRLEEVAGYVRDLGDTVVEQNVESIFTVDVNGDEYPLTGHRCQTNGHRYIIVGHPEWRFMSCIYVLSVERYAGYLVDEETAEQLASIEDSHDGDVRESAGRYLLKTLDSGEMEALENYIYMFVSGGTNRTSTSVDEEGVFIEYSVENSFFPFEADFGIHRFYEAVQSSITAGERGNRLLGRTLFFESEEENPEDLALTTHFGW